MPQIWSDAYIAQLTEDANKRIVQEVNCLYHRFMFATTAQTAIYTLPSKVRGVLRITVKGVPLDPVGWSDFQAIQFSSPTGAGVNLGTPRIYALNYSNILAIGFYPTPDTSFVAAGDPYSPDSSEKCIISCWRNIDITDAASRLPDYIARRTQKAYVLWKAFGKEGRGQNLAAASYYEKKFFFLIDKFRKINEGAFVGKIYELGGSSTRALARPLAPRLPSNYSAVYR